MDCCLHSGSLHFSFSLTPMCLMAHCLRTLFTKSKWHEITKAGRKNVLQKQAKLLMTLMYYAIFRYQLEFARWACINHPAGATEWVSDYKYQFVKNPASCSFEDQGGEKKEKISISNACINFHLTQPSPFDYREGTGMQNEYYTHPLDWAFGFKLMSQCQPQFQPLLAVLNWSNTVPRVTRAFA